MFRIHWLVGLVLISGCTYDPFDPFQRPGTWVPEGSNDANLRAMIVNPHDLVEGTGERVSYGAEAAPPVTRLLTGKRYPLPSLNAADIAVVNQQQPAPGGAP